MLKETDDDDERFVDVIDDDDEVSAAAAAAARTNDADVPTKSSWVHRNNLTCMFYTLFQSESFGSWGIKLAG